MSLVCCPLTKPGVTLAVVRFTHWDDGDDDTHFFLTLPSVGVRLFFGMQSALHFQKSCPRLAIVVLKDFFVFCINGWLVQNSIIGKVNWNIGCKPQDGIITHCVHPYNVVSVPAPLIVSTICHAVLQCSTQQCRQISLQSLMVDTASCYKNDGRETCWPVSSLSFLPFGQSDRCTGVEFSFPFILELRDPVFEKTLHRDTIRTWKRLLRGLNESVD